jgi:hypothetical protein
VQGGHHCTREIHNIPTLKKLGIAMDWESIQEPVQSIMSLLEHNSGSSVQYARAGSSPASRTKKKGWSRNGYSLFAFCGKL